MSTRIITIANQKGGVGKTTTAINLATALAAIGERVLIIDLDPQGNASTGLGIDRQDRGISSYDLMVGEADVAGSAVPTAVPGLSIIASTMDLLGVELEIAAAPDRVLKLRKALREAAQPIEFTYVLIDCPPSLNLLTLNAMAAADSIRCRCSASSSRWRDSASCFRRSSGCAPPSIPTLRSRVSS
jgi:chromosome partitioning protein